MPLNSRCTRKLPNFVVIFVHITPILRGRLASVGLAQARPNKPLHKDKCYTTYVLTACNIKEGALLGGHPQVGGAGIKNNSEGLWWSTDGNVTIILSLKNTEN